MALVLMSPTVTPAVNPRSAEKDNVSPGSMFCLITLVSIVLTIFKEDVNP
jgi:hypothetical protein